MIPIDFYIPLRGCCSVEKGHTWRALILSTVATDDGLVDVFAINLRSNFVRVHTFFLFHCLNSISHPFPTLIWEMVTCLIADTCCMTGTEEIWKQFVRISSALRMEFSPFRFWIICRRQDTQWRLNMPFVGSARANYILGRYNYRPIWRDVNVWYL